MTPIESVEWPRRHWSVCTECTGMGWDSLRLMKAQKISAAMGSAAVMVVHCGRVVAMWGDVSLRLPVHSIRKSLMNALYGRLFAAGKLDLDQSLAELGIDDLEGLTNTEKQATLLDLLAARSGIYHPAGMEDPWMARIRPARGSYAPGAAWIYNNWDFNALGTIYGHLSGHDLLDDFRDEIAAVLSMADFRYDHRHKDAEWIDLPGSMHKGFSIWLSTWDLARFGLLYARRGRWQDVQVIPEDWVTLSTRPHSHAGSLGAYGLLWWVARDGLLYPPAIVSEGAFCAWGYGGHYLFVSPKEDLVIVHRMDTRNQRPRVSHVQFGTLLHGILKSRSSGG